MLLEPRCTASIARSCSNVFWSFLTMTTRQDRALPSHFDGEFWPHNTHSCKNIYSETYGPIVLNKQQKHLFRNNDELYQRSDNQYCSSQPSIVHWLSSSIFPCSSLSRYGDIRINLTSTYPRPPNPYIF